LRGADENLVVVGQKDPLGFLAPVPVNISGFTGEADGVLKNDLLFMGVKHVSIDEAKYLVVGSNAGRVEGRLTDKTTKYQLLAKAYTGGNQRAGSKAVDAGTPLPTINDGFSGTAPDLGALERDQPAPHYGPRWVTWTPFYR
jgi:hypothetical protein